MNCLYCNKRLWWFFFKKGQFCSKQHEAAYHDQVSAMSSRLKDFPLFEMSPAIAPPRLQTPAKIESESKTPAIAPAADPPLCNFIGEQSATPAVLDLPATIVRLEARPFTAPIQLPSGSRVRIAFTAFSESQTSEEATVGPVPAKRSRRPAKRSSGAGPRTSRRKPAVARAAE